MRWFLAIAAYLNHAHLDSPRPNSVSALSKVLASIDIDLHTQQKFQQDKKAYCKTQTSAAKDRIRTAKSETNVLTDDRVKLDVEVQGLQGDVDSLKQKLSAVRNEIDSTETERKAAQKVEAGDSLALKHAIISSDYSHKKTPRDVLNAQLVSLEFKHRKQIAIFIELENDQRKAMIEVEEELQLKRSQILDKKTALAEVVRTMNDNNRTMSRDATYLRSLSNECAVFQKNEGKLKKSRTRLRDLLDRSIALMQKKNQKKSLVQEVGSFAMDVSTPFEDTPKLSFLQMRAQGNVFDDVRERIQEMLRQMESDMNKEKGKHEWCEEETAANDRSRQKYQDHMNTAKSAMNHLRDQIAAQESSQAFAHKMSAKQKKIVDRAEEEIKALDGRFTNAIENAHTLISVVAEVRDSLDDAKISAVLQETSREGKHLLDLLENASGETKETLDEVKINARKAMEARKRDAHDIDLTTAELEDALSEAQTDYNAAKKNLESARSYAEVISSDCGPGNADDAAKRREEEIEALQDSLKVLNGEEIPA